MDIKKGTRRNIFNRYENIFLLPPPINTINITSHKLFLITISTFQTKIP